MYYFEQDFQNIYIQRPSRKLDKKDLRLLEVANTI